IGCRASAAGAAGETYYIHYLGVFPDYINDLSKFFLHSLKRYALVSLNSSRKPPGVLFRKETFWDFYKQSDTYHDNGQHQHDHEPRMTECPGEAHFVTRMHPVKKVLARI